MRKDPYLLALMAAAMGGMELGPVNRKPQRSLTTNKCPTCGKEHTSTKSMSCSAECYKKLRQKQKERL